jgi:hypothetical protein
MTSDNRGFRETQPYLPETAAPHKAAAKISMWRRGILAWKVLLAKLRSGTSKATLSKLE